MINGESQIKIKKTQAIRAERMCINLRDFGMNLINLISIIYVHYFLNL